MRCERALANDGRKEKSDALAETDVSGERGSETTAQMAETLAPTSHARSNELYKAGSLIDRYVVIDELGRGGMGVVLRARDPDLSRTIAIKLLQASGSALSEDARQRMVREGQAIAQLSHPNVVQVYDVGMHGDDVFIAMEYVEGVTVSEWLENKRETSDVIEVMAQAGRGLAAAHAIGIVHRDFKPDNVLIGSDGRVRVLDFGLARVASASDDRISDIAHEQASARELTTTVTVAGTLMGTPAYMAPEQFAGEKVDSRADQFSFCVSLFEALHGTRPFSGDSFESLKEHVTTGVRESASSALSGPRWLSKLIDRGLCQDPSERFSSMNVLLDDMTRVRMRMWPRVAVVALLVVLVAAAVVVVKVVVKQTQNDSPRRSPAVLEAVQRDVVRESGVYLHPNLTPDATSIVYTDRVDILRRVLGQGDRPDLVENLTADFAPAATEPALSPDGQSIAFSAESALYVMAVDGGAPRVVAKRGFWPTWSPDGAQIAYVTEDRYDPWVTADVNEPELWRVKLKTGEASQVIDRATGATQPNWSPDGTRLVFASGNSFMTVRTDGTDIRDTGIRTAWHPVWNQSSDGLYALTERGGRYRVVLFELDDETGEADLAAAESIATISSESPWHFDISPSGREIVASVHSSSLRTYRFEFDPKTQRPTTAPLPVTDPNLGLISPAISASGQWLVYSSLTAVDEDLYVTKIDGSGGRRLLRGNEYRRSPIFSPTDDSIAFQGTVGGTWGIYRVALDGTGLVALATNPSLRFPHYSPDGKRIAVTASPDDSVHFPYIVEVDSPWMPQGIAQHNPDLAGWRTGPFSPDGKWVALFSTKGLARMNSATRQIDLVSPVGSDAAWLGDSRTVIAVDGSSFVLIDTATGERSDLVSLAPARPTTLPSLAITPDNRAVFVSTDYERASIRLIELRERVP